MMTKAKLRGAWKSVTIWFNTVALAALPLLDATQSALPAMKEYTDGRLFGVFAMAVILGNVFLRFKTTQDLKDKT